MNQNFNSLSKPLVVVTGFGPFKNYLVNASWEAVKLMNKEALEDKYNIKLVQMEIPVTYQNVDQFVPALWVTHTPKLMLHVGVSGVAEELKLEMQAHRKGYQSLDYLDKCPADHTCPAEGAICLHTKLDVDRICRELNETTDAKTTASTSINAGRYLCEYIYYTSLSIDNTRTLFIHVPDTNVYSSEKVARALEIILGLCLEQIRTNPGDEIAEKLELVDIQDNKI